MSNLYTSSQQYRGRLYLAHSSCVIPKEPSKMGLLLLGLHLVITGHFVTGQRTIKGMLTNVRNDNLALIERQRPCPNYMIPVFQAPVNEVSVTK